VTRDAVLDRLQREIALGRPIVAAGVGAGLSARSAAAGGADLIVAYHSAPFRLAGVASIAGLMPFANANEVVRDIAGPILRAAADVPVLATACAADPTIDHADLLAEIRDRGFAGVMTAPTATLVDGALRDELDQAGFGFAAELALIRRAHALELVACAYATNPDEAVAAADAGADVVVAHLGVTHRRSAAPALEEASARLRAIARALEGRRVYFLCHGGALTTPGAVRRVLRAIPGVVGYFGASTLERTPIERAVRKATAAYKAGLPLQTNARRLDLDSDPRPSQHGSR
jgi:predicted TIM-barrel enzyme